MNYLMKAAGCVALAAMSIFAFASQAVAAPTISSSNDGTIPGLFVSDIHFDPFHDPAKVSQLLVAPEKDWDAILSSPPSVTQAADFAKLQTSCAASAVDTQYSLLLSSVHAMREKSRYASFIVVSGDLMAHQFTCRFATLAPNATQADYTTFVENTIHLEIAHLRKAFPVIPIYVALGNNDSDCGDYKLDSESAFLAGTAKVLAELALPDEKQELLRQYSTGGYYSIKIGIPLVNARIIVLNDVLLSPRFTNCAGNIDTGAGAAEIDWLTKQLQTARDRNEHAWVVGHIATGIDPFFLSKTAGQNFCSSGSTAAVTTFLSDNSLGDVLHSFSDVISLALFAHTHMDEFRVVEAQGPGPVSGPAVALKMVPSISPVDGNYPSFTVAAVDPFKAQWKDYTVFQASNQTGVDATWSKEYSFRETYGVESFTPDVLKKLLAGFQADPTAQSPAAQSYINYYDVNNKPAWLTSQWPKYVCALSHMTVDDFATCACQ